MCSKVLTIFPVFTPSILVADNYYFLTYTAVPEPFSNKTGRITPTAIGMVKSKSPNGPWVRVSKTTILAFSEDHNEFDSLRIDDTCFVSRNGEYWMYYKGRQWDRSPGQTQMGVAIAKQPEGPYFKHKLNPVLDSGHEVCVWPHGKGVGCMVSNVGPQRNTLMYSDDGLNFIKVSDTIPPKAPGPYREDNFIDGKGPGISWGIAMVEKGSGWPFLVRFDCNLKAADSN